MKWTLIDKKLTKRPATVTEYSKYRPELRLEAEEKCVYCAIHESSLGGSDSFHVEHYKPKSKFSELTNDFENLFYACAICNRFKSNDWPNEPKQDHSIPSYPDPKLVNYNTLFDIDIDGVLRGRYPASKYMIEKVVLNRPQLINERRERILRKRLGNAILKLEILGSQLLYSDKSDEQVSLLGELITLSIEMNSFQNNETSHSKYRPCEIKRTK